MINLHSGSGLGLFDHQQLASHQSFNNHSGPLSVNLNNGNVINQRRDMIAIGQGIDIEFVQTYNSLGRLNGQSDNFTHSFEERLRLSSGNINEDGSVIERYTGDGFIQRFTYDNGLYRSTEGDGAHDQLERIDDERWVWTEGSSQEKRYYESDGTNQWRIHQIEDREGHSLAISYNSDGQVNVISDQTGQAVLFNYNDQGRIASIFRLDQDLNDFITRTYYDYDDYGRLSSVIVDLSPDDQSINDDNTFVTNYYYHGTTERIHQLIQSDGRTWTFQYDSQERVTRMESGAGSSLSAMEFVYSANQTDVTYLSQNNALTHNYIWNSAGQLKEHRGPVDRQGNQLVTSYTYNVGNGDEPDDASQVTRVENNAGDFTAWDFDGNGNLVSQTSHTGVRLEYGYDSNNLVTEQKEIASNGESRSRYFVYDDNQRVRFEIGVDGIVSETRYDDGQPLAPKVSTFQYSSIIQNTTFDLSSMEAWANTYRNAQVNRVDTELDFRGQVSRVIEFDNALDSQSIASEYIYSYDASGNLLSRVSPKTSQLPASTEYFVYDGLGRQIKFTDALNGVTTTDWQGNQMITREQSGLMTTVSFDSRGLILSEVKQDAFANDKILASTHYHYDELGRLKAQEDANGLTHFIFDAKGRVAAKVNSLGDVERYHYDLDDQLVQTEMLQRRMNVSNLRLDYQTGTVRNNTNYVDSIDALTRNSESDRISFQTYNAKDQLVFIVDADGYVTEMHYDGFGRLIAEEQLDSSIFDNQNYPLETLRHTVFLEIFVNDLRNENTKSRLTRTFYDSQDRVIGKLDASGYLTTYHYNTQGHRYAEKRVAEQQSVFNNQGQVIRERYLNSNLADFNSSLTNINVNDQIRLYYFDSQGQEITQVELSKLVNGLGEESVTGYATHFYYDERGNRVKETSIATPFDFTTEHEVVLAFADLISGSADFVERNFDSETAHVLSFERSSSNDDHYTVDYRYDDKNRLTGKFTSNGLFELYQYDSRDQLSEIIRYSEDSDEFRTEQFAYNALGQQEKTLTGDHILATADQDQIEDQIGAAREYDNQGRLAKEVDAKGNATRYFYDKIGRLSTKVDAKGYAEKYYYNQFGELTSTREFANPLDQSGLQAANTTEEINALLIFTTEDRRTRTTYNRRGLIATQDTAMSLANLKYPYGLIRHEYNGFEQNTVTREGKAFASNQITVDLVTRREFDRRGHVTSQERSASNGSVATRTSSAVYDAFGRKISEVTEQGSVNTYGYDGRNLLLHKSGDHFANESYHYDAFGRVLSVTDALGETSTYEYNFAENKSTITTAEGIQLVTQKNAFGDVIKTISGEGVVSEFLYDSAGRLHKTIAGGTEIINTYDDNGNLVVQVKGDESTTYHYDVLNQQWLKEQNRNGRIVNTYYHWNGFGERTESSINQQGAVSYSYDHAGNEILRITDAEGADLFVNSGLDPHLYNAQGLMSESYLSAAGIETELVYDDQGQVIGTRLFTPLNENGWKVSGELIIEHGELKRDNGTYGWDVAAAHAKTIDVNSRVDFTVSSNKKHQMMGLNRNDLSDPAYAELDYAFYLTSADDIIIYENGNNIHHTQLKHDSANRYRLWVDDNQLHYQIKFADSEEFVTVHTSDQAVAADDTFNFQTAFFQTGSSVSDIRIQSDHYVTQQFAEDGNLMELVYNAQGQLLETRQLTSLREDKWVTEGDISIVNGQLTRSDGSYSWNVAAAYNQTVTHNSRIDFNVDSTSKNLMTGLNRELLEDASYQTLDYAFYMGHTDDIILYENGDLAYRTQLKHDPENRYRFWIDNSQVHYQVKFAGSHEFVTIHTSENAVAADDKFYLQGAFFHTGTSISNVQVQTEHYIAQPVGTANHAFQYFDLTKTDSSTAQIESRSVQRIDANGNIVEQVYNESGQLIANRPFSSVSDQGWITRGDIIIENGELLRRTNGYDWNVAAAYAERLTTNRRVDFSIPGQGGHAQAGLTTGTSDYPDNGELDFSFVVNNRNQIIIREKGAQRFYDSQLTHHADNRYRIWIDTSEVHYQIKFADSDQFVTVYTSKDKVNSDDYFHLQVSLSHLNASVSNIQVQDTNRSVQPISVDSHVTESIFDAQGNIIGTRQFEKVTDEGWTIPNELTIDNGTIQRSDGNYNWDVAAAHSMTIYNNSRIDFSADSVREHQMFGLNREAVSDNSHYRDLDYAFYFTGSDDIYIYENGLTKFHTQLKHHPENRYRLWVDETQVHYQIKFAGSREFVTVHTSEQPVIKDDTFKLQGAFFGRESTVSNIQVQRDSSDKIATSSRYDAANRQVFVAKYKVGGLYDYKKSTQYNVFDEVISTAEGIDTFRHEFFNYNDNGQLIYHRDKSGQVHRYIYGANGKVALEFHSLGRIDGEYKYSVIEYQYTANRLVSKTIAHKEAVAWRNDTIENWRISLSPQGESVGAISKYLYDRDDRLRFTIDGDGRVVERVYNKDNQIIERIQHSKPLPESAPKLNLIYEKKRFFQISFDYTVPSYAHAELTLTSEQEDRIYRFDSNNPGTTETFVAGQYSAEFVLRNSEGQVIANYQGEFTYKDGRFPLDLVTGQISFTHSSWSDFESISNYLRYDNSTSASSTGLLEDTRYFRTFYDEHGRKSGEMDGEGFVTEFNYDASGRVYETVRYGNKIENWIGGQQKADWQPSSAAGDYRAFNIYDDLGKIKYLVELAGTPDVDISLYARVTEYAYNDANLKIAERKFDNYLVKHERDDWLALLGSLQSGDASINSIANMVGEKLSDQNASVQTWQYDQSYRLVASRNEQGVYTKRELNSLGQVIQESRTARDGETRHRLNRYNDHGQLIQSVDSETIASQQITLDSWQEQGVHRTFDGFGRLIETRDKFGEKAWYFYEGGSHATLVMNALGEITQKEYNAFGKLDKETRMLTRYTGDLSAINGGDPSNILQFIEENNQEVLEKQFYYHADGRLWYETNGYTEEYNYYNSLGELSQASKFFVDYQPNSSQSLIARLKYDGNGRVAYEERQGLHSERVYDAWGRVVHDNRGEGSNTYYIRSGFGDIVGEVNGYQTGVQQTNIREYDATGRIKKEYVEGTPWSVSYEYDRYTLTQTKTSASGIRTSVKSNDFGNVITQTDGLGRVIEQTSYDKLGRVISKTDANGFKVTTNYSLQERIERRTDKNDNVTEYHYDAIGRVTKKVIDPDGLALTTQTIWNALGQKDSTINANGALTKYTYDDNGVLETQLVDVGGENLLTRFVLDQHGNRRVEKVGRLIGDEEVFNQVTSYRYDKNNNVIEKVVDPGDLNIVTTYERDSRTGRIYSETDASGAMTIYVRDGQGREKFRLEPVGLSNNNAEYRIIENIYDLRGNLITVKEYIESTGGVTEQQQDIQSIRALIFDLQSQSSRTTTQLFDEDSRLRYVFDPSGLVTEHRYDDRNLLVSKVHYAKMVLGNRGISYEGMRNLLSTDAYTQVENRETRYVYDAAGRQTHVIDALGHVTKTSYDSVGNKVETLHYSTALKENESVYDLSESDDDQRHIKRYDNANRLILEVNSEDYVTRYERDSLGRVLEEMSYSTPYHNEVEETSIVISQLVESDDDRRKTKRYDTAGRLVLEIDSAGYATQYQRNALGKVQGKIQFANAFVGEVRDAAYSISQLNESNEDRRHVMQYDAASRLLLEVDSSGYVTKYQRDALGQVEVKTSYATALATIPNDSEATINITTSVLDRSTSYLYDTAGRQVAIKDSLNHVIKKEYDVFGQVSKTTYLYSPQTEFSLNSFEGFNEWQTHELDRVESFLYDSAGRIERKYQGEITDGTAFISYHHDSLGNLIYEKDYAGNYVLYGHDRLGNRTREVKQHNQAPDYRREGYVTDFTFDAFGNLSTEIRFNKPAKMYREQQGSSGLELAGNIYDAYQIEVVEDGAIQTGDRFYKYEYDSLNRLTLVTLPLVNEGESPTVIKTDYNRFGDVERKIEAYGSSDARTTEYRYNNRGLKTQQIEAFGTAVQATTRYTYNDFGEVETVTDPRAEELITTNKTWTKRFREAHGFAANVSGLTLDQKEQLRKLYTAKNIYDKSGNKIEEHTPSWQVNDYLTFQNKQAIRKFTYDGFGNAIKIQDAEGGETFYFRDSQGQIRFEVDAMGFVTQHTYDVNGNVTRTNEYVNSISNGNYNENLTYEEIVELVDENRNKDARTDYTYNALGQLELKKYYALNSNLANYETVYYVERFKYDSMGNNEQYTNRLGGIFNYTYDALGRRVSELTPEQNYAIAVNAANVTRDDVRVINRFEYDRQNNLISETKAANFSDKSKTTLYEFNKLGKLISKTQEDVIYYTLLNEEIDLGDAEIQIDYDKHGNKISETDEFGNTTYFYYNAQNQLTYIKDREGYWQEFGYDTRGNLVYERRHANHYGNRNIDLEGLPVHFETQYGGRTELVRADYSNDRRLYHEYDANNNRIKTTTPPVVMFEYSKGFYEEAITTKTTFNSLGRATSIIDGNGETTRIFYDLLGNEVLTIAPDASVTRREYEMGRGLVTREIKYEKRLSAQQIVLARKGNLLDLLDDDIHGLYSDNSPGNREKVFDYNRQGFLISSALKTNEYHSQSGLKNTDENAKIETKFGVNADGQVEWTENADGTRHYALHDTQGRLYHEFSNGFKISYKDHNDPDIELTKMVNERVKYVYDVQGNLAETRKVGDSDSLIRDREVRFERDRHGNVIREHTAGADWIEYYYDKAGNQIQKKTHTWSVRNDFTYKTYTVNNFYDKLGRRVSFSNENIKENFENSEETWLKNEELNAFGDVSYSGDKYYSVFSFVEAPKHNHEFSLYNHVGRVVKTNEGDGVKRLQFYDNNGNLTLVVKASDWSQLERVDVKDASVLNSMNIESLHLDINAYDKNGNLITHVAQPMSVRDILRRNNGTGKNIDAYMRNSDVREQFSYNSFGEKASHTDFNGNLTEFEYDDRGLLIKTVLPSIDVSLPGKRAVNVGFIKEASGRAETQNIYDIMGRFLARIDANKNVQDRHRYENGRLVSKDDFEYQYNVMGEVSQEIKYADDEGTRGIVINYLYDGFGSKKKVTKRLIETGERHIRNVTGDFRTVNKSVDEYQYDSLGQRLFQSTSGGDEIFHYDGFGRVVSYSDQYYNMTKYDYDYDESTGDTTKEIFVNGLLMASEVHNYHQQKEDSTNLAGQVLKFEYDDLGLLESETSLTPGKDSHVEYKYFDNGWLKGQYDYINRRFLNLNYDNNGNRTLEKYHSTADNGDVIFYQNTVAKYNDRNMIESLTDLGRFEIEYSYDFEGNHTVIKTRTDNDNIWNINVYGYTSKNQIETVWMNDAPTYNRWTWVKMKSYSYNNLGQRTDAVKANKVMHRIDSPEEYRLIEQTNEKYHYNVHGQIDSIRVSESTRYNYLDANYYIRDGRAHYVFKNYHSSGKNLSREMAFSIAERSVDGQVVEIGDKTLERDVGYIYDDLGRIEVNINNLGWSRKHNYEQINYLYEDNFMTKEITTGYREGDASSDSLTITKEYTPITYDSEKRKKEIVTVEDRVSEGVYSFDNKGNTTEYHEDIKSGDSERFQEQKNNYFLRHDGKVAYRKVWKGPYIEKRPRGDSPRRARTSEQYFYYFNGVAVGDNGGSGSFTRDYGAELAGLNSNSNQNFNYLERTISDAMIGSGSNSYIVQKDDDLRSIALSVWGDGSLWYLIAEANGIGAGESLSEGLRLEIPNTFTGAHNNNTTFRPYDATNAIGDTSVAIAASMPPPPPPSPSKCAIATAIIVSVVIAVAAAAISVVSFGSLTGAVGPLAAAGIGAVIGATVAAGANAATQGIMIGTGLQEEWDWGQFGSSVAVGAIGGAVSGSIGSAIHGAKNLGDGVRFGINMAKTAVMSLANEAISVGAQKLIYPSRETKFDWKNVLVSSFTGAMSNVGDKMMGQGIALNKPSSFSRVASGAVRSLTKATINEGVSALVHNRKFDFVSVAKSSLIGFSSQLISTKIQENSYRRKVEEKLRFQKEEIQAQRRLDREMGLALESIGITGNQDISDVDLLMASGNQLEENFSNDYDKILRDAGINDASEEDFMDLVKDVSVDDSKPLGSNPDRRRRGTAVILPQTDRTIERLQNRKTGWENLPSLLSPEQKYKIEPPKPSVGPSASLHISRNENGQVERTDVKLHAIDFQNENGHVKLFDLAYTQHEGDDLKGIELSIQIASIKQDIHTPFGDFKLEADIGIQVDATAGFSESGIPKSINIGMDLKTPSTGGTVGNTWQNLGVGPLREFSVSTENSVSYKDGFGFRMKADRNHVEIKGEGYEFKSDLNRQDGTIGRSLKAPIPLLNGRSLEFGGREQAPSTGLPTRVHIAPLQSLPLPETRENYNTSEQSDFNERARQANERRREQS